MKKPRLLVALSIMACISGCTPTMQQMRERFDSEVQHMVGSTFDQVRIPYEGLIGDVRKPTETRRIGGDNVLYVYKEFWLQEQILRSPCDLFIEIALANGVIVSAYSQGDGCFMPY